MDPTVAGEASAAATALLQTTVRKLENFLQTGILSTTSWKHKVNSSAARDVTFDAVAMLFPLRFAFSSLKIMTSLQDHRRSLG